MIEIKIFTARLLKDRYKIEENITNLLFDEGILQPHDCRDVLIREEYNKKVSITGRQMLKYRIADKYCVSVATVEKIIAKK